MNPLRRTAPVLALLVAQSVHAQETTLEVGSATAWFALLVVVFALLVSVGLFMARDHEETTDAEAEARSAEPPARTARRAPHRHAHARHKRQEFS